MLTENLSEKYRKLPFIPHSPLSTNGDKYDGLSFYEVSTSIILEARQSQTISFSEYLQMVGENLDKDPQYSPLPHPADVLSRAIASYPILTDTIGRKRYTFFADRGDRYAYFGNPYHIGLIDGFIRERTSRIRGMARGSLLTAPTGAGKSTIVDGLISGFEEHTRERELIYGIKGCPYQDSPLLLLPYQARAELYNRYSLVIEGDLCPHCQNGKSILETPVEPIQFSVTQGVGIVRIPQELTANFDNLDVQAIVYDRMLRANRGILEIPELFHHSPAFLKALMGIIREGRIQRNGITYYPQFFTIAHATLNDLKRFKDLVKDKKIEIDADAFEQRFNIATLPYVVSQDDELELYKKVLREGDYSPHLSPQTLEIISFIAIASRLIKSIIPNVDAKTKIAIYNSQDTAKFTQQDREKIEAEGREHNEGYEGISPVKVVELLGAVLKESPQCLNPIRTMLEIKRYVDRQPQNYPRKTEILSTISEQSTLYIRWLEQAVRSAFRGDFEAACEQKFQYYLDHAGAYAIKQKVFDQATKEDVDPDERFLRNVETYLGISENEKRQFRDDINIRHLQKARKRNIKEDPLSYKDFDDFREGFKEKWQKMVSSEYDKETNEILLALLSIPAEKRLSLDLPDEKMGQKLQAACQNLIEKYGFCPCCAPELIIYTASYIYKKGVDGSLPLHI